MLQVLQATDREQALTVLLAFLALFIVVAAVVWWYLFEFKKWLKKKP